LKRRIFPRAWCEKNGIPRSRYDTIVNKTPLTAKTNRIIGGAAPSSYLSELRKAGAIASDADLDTHITSHAVDPKCLRADDFDAAYAARRERLLALIQECMGQQVYRGHGADEATEEIEGAEPALPEAAE
jgi:hypothetical protein